MHPFKTILIYLVVFITPLFASKFEQSDAVTALNFLFFAPVYFIFSLIRAGYLHGKNSIKTDTIDILIGLDCFYLMVTLSNLNEHGLLSEIGFHYLLPIYIFFIIVTLLFSRKRLVKYQKPICE
jgi:hypothetical protein